MIEPLLANWDAGEEDHTNLSAASILETVRQTFHGQRVLFLIDCCSSGGLAEQLQEQPGEKPALALTSSSANESSTDAWTFTQALLDGLRGEPHLDLDRDGTILLSELARSIRLDMASFHGQMAAFVTTNRFPTNLELSRVARQPDPGEGERVEAKDEGAWWPARVIRREGDRILVRWLALGFDTAASDEWKKPQQVRSLASGPVYPGGTRVEVKWKNRFYPAVVLKVEDGIHLVHYLDYGSEWDEWVPARRIKKPD